MQAVRTRSFADLFKNDVFKNDGVFSRQTSADEEHVLAPLTQDSLPTASSSTRDSLPAASTLTRDTLPSASSSTRDSLPSPYASDKEDRTSNSSDTEDDASFALSIDKPLKAISGVWWAATGERYNVERTAQGVWRCIRRGVKLGQQKVYSLTCESDTGRVIWNNSFTLDTCDVTKDDAIWRTRPTAAKRKKCTWTRTKPSDVQVAEEAVVATQVEVDELKADESRSYSLGFMLQVRVKLLEADVLSGEEHLGISCQGKQTRRQNSSAKEEQQPAEDSDATVMTTVMLRNLPNQCTRSMLLEWLSTTEFKEAFDLLYVPMDKTSGNNLGYCFVNFVEAASCQRFIKVIDGRRAAKCFAGSRSSKVMRVCYAKVQGKEAYVQGMNMLSEGDAEHFATLPAGTYSMPAEAAAEAEIAESSAEPSVSASSFTGFRKDAPEFVPNQAASMESMDTLLEALTGMSMEEYTTTNPHAEAAARAEHYCKQIYPGGLFVPPQKVVAPAEK